MLDILKAIHSAVERGGDYMAELTSTFATMSVVPRQFSDEPLYEETPYPQEGTLDEIDLAVDRGLISPEEGDELAAVLRQGSVLS